jgi:peptide/nickel transport system permease protein
VFLSVHLTGGPAQYLLGPASTEADYEQLKKNLGLDRPLPVQYWGFLKRAAVGDFGRSPIVGVPPARYYLSGSPLPCNWLERQWC